MKIWKFLKTKIVLILSRKVEMIIHQDHGSAIRGCGRVQRRGHDKIYKTRPVFNYVLEKCKHRYVPGCELSRGIGVPGGQGRSAMHVMGPEFKGLSSSVEFSGFNSI